MHNAIVIGTSRSVKARKEGPVQANRQQKTNSRGLTSRSTKRTVPGESSDSGATLRAEQAEPPCGLERLAGEWNKKPWRVGLTNTVSVETRGECSTTRD